jgi:quercetin dioxygenase-like cupin family protein
MEVQTKHPTAKGPTDWFTGDVFVDPVATNQGPSAWSLGSVHFIPCAHTAWHYHTLGQTLFVTEGQGFVQGDTVWGEHLTDAQYPTSDNTSENR